VRMFTQGLSRELGPRGITVNAVAPGPIDTDANPAAGPAADMQLKTISLGRFGHVDEVASIVSYLAGPESSFSNGSTFTADGGVNA
jgi:3-oxoacyl-[acyl-carrier protein] reductase